MGDYLFPLSAIGRPQNHTPRPGSGSDGMIRQTFSSGLWPGTSDIPDSIATRFIVRPIPDIQPRTHTPLCHLWRLHGTADRTMDAPAREADTNAVGRKWARRAALQAGIGGPGYHVSLDAFIEG